MSLVESLTLVVGPALAKSVLKFWLKDHVILSDVGASLVDVFKAKGADAITQHRGKRQFEEIGEKIAESLLPVFDIDGVKLPENSRNAVALMVAETLNKANIKPELLAERNLDPTKLSAYLFETNPIALRDFSEAESELYRRVILESSEAILDIASQLPHFSERTLGEVLRREDQLRSIASNILDEVKRIREGSALANSEADATRFETEYRRAIVRKLDELELFGVDASSASRRHRLSVAYITLSVEHSAAAKPRRRVSSASSEWIDHYNADKSEKKDVMPVDIALARSNRLLIRGLAGSGKTTLLQWAAVRSASQNFGDALSQLNNTIPFFIRLRQCLDFRFPSPEEFPKLIAPAIADRKPQRWVHDQLELGRAIVFVDGIDEVPESRRQPVREQLIELVQTYPKSRFIVTSRPSAVEEGWLRRDGFADAELQPMQPPDIVEFIKHWHAAVRDELQDKEERDALEPLAANVITLIRRNTQISNLATSPLLCSMICALHRDRRRQIPSDRVELYEACSHMLIERRDLERGVELSDYIRLTYRQKTVLLKDLAYWLLKNGWSAVALERAEQRINNKLPHMTDLPKSTTGDEVLRLFVDRSGMLRKPVPDQVDFTHRTFQEFLAAQAALAEGDIGALIKNGHDYQWRETIILATGLANRNDREEIIKGLIKRGDKEHKSQLYLLAMACIDASVELGAEVKKLAQQRLSKLVPPKNADEVDVLATAGELAVPYLSGLIDADRELISLCIRTLARIGGSAALDAIEEYSLKVPEGCLEDFIKAWSAFDGTDYAQRVLSHALAGTDHLALGSDAVLTGLEFLPHLKSLKIVKNFRLYDLSAINSLTAITELKLPFCEYLENLNGIGDFPNLMKLELRGCKRISNIAATRELSNLVELDLSGCNVPDIGPIAELKNLEVLGLKNCSEITDFTPLSSLPKLTKLDLGGCSQLRDLTPIEQLTGLEALSLIDCRQLHDLTKLTGLTRLTKLMLGGCHRIADIGALNNLVELEELDLSYLDGVNDLAPLKNLSKLKILWLYSNLEVLKRSLPLGLRALIYR